MLQAQLDQQKEQLATGEATKLEIEAVRDYRQLRQQQQRLEGQVKQLTEQLAQVRKHKSTVDGIFMSIAMFSSTC